MVVNPPDSITDGAPVRVTEPHAGGAAPGHS
jgi:hypothetical protein